VNSPTNSRARRELPKQARRKKNQLAFTNTAFQRQMAALQGLSGLYGIDSNLLGRTLAFPRSFLNTRANASRSTGGGFSPPSVPAWARRSALSPGRSSDSMECWSLLPLLHVEACFDEGKAAPSRRTPRELSCLRIGTAS